MSNKANTSFPSLYKNKMRDFFFSFFFWREGGDNQMKTIINNIK